MLKKFLVYPILLLILVLAAAIPVFAKSKNPVGPRLVIIDGEDKTISGPFHVLSGHEFTPNADTGLGKTDYMLEINGVEQVGQNVRYKIDGMMYHVKLFNFPDGLPPGEYQFKGTWIDPCAMFEEDCDKKNELLDPPFVVEITVTVEP